MRRDGNLAAGGEGDLASLPVLEEKHLLILKSLYTSSDS
jgi:hypothetical protein